MFLHLLCTHCERRLKNFIAFNTLLSESQRSLERVEKFIEKSLSALPKTRDNLVARVSQGTRRGLDLELCDQNPKLRSGRNVWQILWLTVI